MLEKPDISRELAALSVKGSKDFDLQGRNTDVRERDDREQPAVVVTRERT
jgi:hypothetical protein